MPSRAQHRQQLVRRAKTAKLQHLGCHSGERLEFFGRIGTQVHLGASQARHFLRKFNPLRYSRQPDVSPGE